MQTKLRVKIDDSPLNSGHALRGMGFYMRNLVDSIKESKKVELSDNDYDIIHYPYFDLFANTLHIIDGKKTVVTIPDLIPLMYPKIYKPGFKGRKSFAKQLKALKKVDAIITISETSKKDIVRLLKIPAEKIYVTYLGPGNKHSKTKMHLDLPDDYILYVGDVNWNKNIVSFIKAVNKANLNLVIVGKHARDILESKLDTPVHGPRDVLRTMFGQIHPEVKHFRELQQLLRNSKNVTTLGYVEDEEFAAVYQQATIYCQPSFYEGFGLPLLEAMEAKLPIAASKTQALVEIAGDAALYFDPYSIQDMSDKLRMLIENKKMQQELVSKGSGRVKYFSWDFTAEETIKVYENL